MRIIVFKKKVGETVRYWTPASGKDANNNDIKTSVTIRLSNDAIFKLGLYWKHTKNPDIQMCEFDTHNCWFGATRNKAGDTYTYLFVNDVEPAAGKSAFVDNKPEQN